MRLGLGGRSTVFRGLGLGRMLVYIYMDVCISRAEQGG